MIRCQKCNRENPDDAAFCNMCGAALKGNGQTGSSVALPKKEKSLALPGLFSTTVITESQFRIRIALEICAAIVLIVVGFAVGQPFLGILLGVMALMVGYVIYLFSTEAS